jgi:predicted TIM-barrel fold metal-dependent hydrolase
MGTFVLSRFRSLVILLLDKISFWRRPHVAFQSSRHFSEREVSARVPVNSWDSHMHVIDPNNYPLAAGAKYTPKTHDLSQAMSFESSVGFKNVVIVQPSVYGNDNSCVLDALRRLGPSRAHAVVAFDPETINTKTLQEWHELGVRGVRVNLQSVGTQIESSVLAVTLQRYADIIRPFDWVLQLYVALNTAKLLEKIVSELRVKVCLDHFGCPSLPCPENKSLYSASTDPYTLPGFSSLVNLLRQGDTYIKLSAPYRISKEESHRDLEPVAKELLKVAGKRRVVFATDWPHTRFEGLDIKPYIETALEWCGNDKRLAERLFRENAEDLWGVKR